LKNISEETKPKMYNPIIITGPTASGKTSVAAALGKLVDGEIISADSRQVYRYLDVGTNKAGILDKEKKVRVVGGISQQLTDLINPDETFDAGGFVELAGSLIKKLKNSRKTPIIAGGTGLYIKSLIDGIISLPEKDTALREELKTKIEKNGRDYVYKKLLTVDPVSAEKNRQNPQRLIRAWEVYKLTGFPITYWHKKTVPSKEKFIQFALTWPREELYQNINQRSKDMLKNGMIDETKKVLKMGYGEKSPGFQSVGYRYIISYLNGEINYETLEELLSRDTRHYAKRQLTWFRGDTRINWIETNTKAFNPKIIAGKMLKMLPKLI
jgi:tRNA dimethylallyltransferase